MKYYGQRMDIDKTTLTDLEVFEARDGTRGLFDLIDRTSTRQGSHALRRRIEHPSSDIDTIRGTQEAIAFLQAHPGLVDFDETLIEGVAQYLRSRIVGVETAAGIREHSEHAWMRLRYRDLLKEIANGVATTRALFGRVAQRCERLSQSAPPAAVAQIVGRLAGVADVVHPGRGSAVVLRTEGRRIEQALRSTAPSPGTGARADRQDQRLNSGW